LKKVLLYGNKAGETYYFKKIEESLALHSWILSKTKGPGTIEEPTYQPI
jgi:hypothetical protein